MRSTAPGNLPSDRLFISESVVEDAALAWLEALGYSVLHGPDIAVGEPLAERTGALETSAW